MVIFVWAFLVCTSLRAKPAQSGRPEVIQPGKLMEKVVCKADPTQSYALYIPTIGARGPLPIIYFFDPHGAGTFPLNKYKLLAETYGFILVGSNNSKNGNDYSTSETIWQKLYADTRGRWKILPNRMYTCGFSGGAKVASFIAIQHPEIKGVIAGGAGLPDGVGADNFPFSVTLLAGEGDMNLTDLIAINDQLDKTRTRHRIIFFDGKHEWAPAAKMDIAFAGLQLDAMQGALIPKDNSFINRIITASKSRLEGYYKTNQLIKAGQECRLSAQLLDGVSNESAWFKEKMTTLTANAQYQKQLQTQQGLLVKEQYTKAEYMPHFQQGDERYWNTIINDLKAKAKAGGAGGTANAERGMNQRLLAYLSLAFYSLSNRMISSNDNAGALHFVSLYKLADPSNSEAWYFSALLNARNKQTKAATSDLEKAIDCGFNDKDRLMHQPEFQGLDLSGVKRKWR